MSLDQWIAAIDDILAVGAAKITFIGGEPSIRLDLVQKLSSYIQLKSPKTQLRMFSNLAIRSKVREIVDVVKSHDIEFGTALYGLNPVQHDTMTGKLGSWEVTLAAISLCAEQGVDVFVGVYLDTADGIDLPRYDTWMQEHRVKRYEVIAPSKVGRGIDKDWRLPAAVNNLPTAMTFSPHQAKISSSAHNCYYDHLVIRPDGLVSPCIMTRNVAYGNIADGTTALFASAAYQGAASLSKDEIEGCSACEFRYACFDCRPDAMQGGDDWRKKPDCGYDPQLELGASLTL